MCDALWDVWAWLGRNGQGIVALVALFVAVWEVVSSRKHNRLSVKPELVFSADSHEDDAKFAFSILNTGLGPARIVSFQYLFDRTPLRDTHPNTLRAHVEALFKTESHRLHAGRLNPGHMMAPNDKQEIIGVEFRDLAREQVKRVLKEMERYDCVVVYESLYGDKDTLDTSMQVHERPGR